MNKFKHVLMALLCLSFSVSTIFAQSADKPWSIGLTGGKMTYNGDYGNGFFNFDQPFHGQGGLILKRYLNSSLDLSVEGTYGRTGYWIAGQSDYLANMFFGNVEANYKFNNGYILSEDARIAPFIFAGLGVGSFNPVDGRGTKATNFIVPVGLGTKVKIIDDLDFFWKSTFGAEFGDKADGVDFEKNEKLLLHQIGFQVNFGAGKDTDGDGISDKKDACPEVPGLKEFSGCPDTDGDGITDAKDTCPNEAGPVEFLGCPDSDGDGIADNKDACPNTAGSKALNGCPDSDGDGIADNKDNCPTIKGTSANKGCPTVSNEHKTVFLEALRGVNFETGKSVIKTESYGILNKVAQIMNDNPHYNLAIEGHTDNVGEDASNMTLSQDRANSVKTYLTNKGVSSSRMTAQGFGETRPVSTNETKEGRAENRRVEFKVSF